MSSCVRWTDEEFLYLCCDMKTRSIALVALLLAGAYAQEGTFKVGAAILPQNTWLLNQDDSDAGPELDYEVTWGFAGGLTLGYNFTDYLGVGLDILYSSQGQKYKGKDNSGTYTARTSLNYLKLPLLFRVGSDPNSPVQFSLFLGPQANILLSYRDKFDYTGPGGSTASLEVKGKEVTTTISIPPIPTITETEELTAPAYKPFTFGAVFGLGMGFKLSDELLLTLHFRGDYTFGDVENKDAAVSHGNHSDPYWEQKPKYTSVSHGTNTSERPATAAITGGLMLGITYNIPLR